MADERTRAMNRGNRALLLVNLVLSALKITMGLVVSSVSLLADGANNLSDTAGSFGCLLIARAASRPSDEGHPYGHGRMEYLATLGVGVLVLSMGLELLKNGIHAIRFPSMPAFSPLAVAALILSILSKLFLGTYLSRIGSRWHLPVMQAESRDSYLDVAASGVVLTGILVSHWTGVILDGYLGTAVSLLILLEGFQICMNTAQDLIGRRPDQETGMKILEILHEEPMILSCHDLRLHDYGPGRIFASVDVVVDGRLTLNEIHPAISRAEGKVMERFSIPLTIHMDPLQTPDNGSEKILEALKKVAERYAPCRFHDLDRYVKEDRVQISVDMEMPPGSTEKKEAEAAARQAILEIEPDAQVTISLDVDYYEAYRHARQ